ncbi:MAG: transposase [Anaerostipes sp.]
MIDGRYSFPYVPEGIYAEIREVVSSRDRIMKELNAASNRIQRWLKIYFPEYLTVYKKFDTTTGMMILEKAPLPDMVKALGADHIVKIWRQQKVRGKGASLNRAKTWWMLRMIVLENQADEGAVMEIQMLLEDHKVKKQQLEMVTTVMEELTMQIPNADKMLSVDGIGLVTVAGFISEVGDISRFKNPKQIQKYAGFELVENSSGKHKGRTTISKRGRKKLRKIIYQVVLPLIRSNQEFGSIYDYYRKRIKNPLKGRQAMIAVGCKLIRVFFAIMTEGCCL